MSITSDRSRARRYAVQALYEWQVSGNSPKEIEQQFLIFLIVRQPFGKDCLL